MFWGLSIVVFFFFSFSFSDLLGLREYSLAAPTWWRLLEELLAFSKQQGGTKKADMSRRNLNLIPQETFLKFLVKWSWILFTYERSKLSLLPPIKPQCTILFFALHSFYWASIFFKLTQPLVCYDFYSFWIDFGSNSVSIKVEVNVLFLRSKQDWASSLGFRLALVKHYDFSAYC